MMLGEFDVAALVAQSQARSIAAERPGTLTSIATEEVISEEEPMPNTTPKATPKTTPKATPQPTGRGGRGRGRGKSSPPGAAPKTTGKSPPGAGSSEAIVSVDVDSGDEREDLFAAMTRAFSDFPDAGLVR